MNNLSDYEPTGRKTMAEYIDKQAATAYAPLPRELREYQTANLDDAFEYGYDFAIGQIDAIPAADVRPVVLCKDCKWTKTDGMEDPAIYCKKWDRWEMPPDGFCWLGKKREKS